MASRGSVEQERLSWPVLLLTLAAVTSSSLSALSLYQLVALRTEMEGLKSEVCHRRTEQQERGQRAQEKSMLDNFCAKRSNLDTWQRPEHTSTLMRRKRVTTNKELLAQPCLQFLANGNRKIFKKEFDFYVHTAIPWQTGLKQGSALEEDQDRILIQQEGYYFVYSQVYYMDTQVAMGHVVIRWKASVVGNEVPHVVLFRCIKNMRHEFSFNTCYTGGIVKLDIGDHLELLIPRTEANISLDGEGTFMGALKLV